MVCPGWCFQNAARYFMNAAANGTVTDYFGQDQEMPAVDYETRNNVHYWLGLKRLLWVMNWPQSLSLSLSLSPGHLLWSECVSSRNTESIPPQRLHGSRAVQPDPVRFSWPLPAQKFRQWRLLASESPHPQHHQAKRQAVGHWWAGRQGQDELSGRLSVPVLQRLSGGHLQSDWPSAPKRDGYSGQDISTAVCCLTDRLCAPLLKHHVHSRRSCRF